MPNRRRLLHHSNWVVAAVALVVAGLFLKSWLAPANEMREGAALASAHPSDPAIAASGAAEAKSTALPRVATSAEGASAIPAGLTADQWQTLQQRVEPGPGHDREVARIVDFLEFQRRVVHLRESRSDPGAAGERPALARQIDAGIATHLALHEISGAEAMLLKTAVLAETEPDPAQRVQRLADWQRDWANEHPPESDPRFAEYQRQEAAAVAAWQSGPPSQRDPAQLARQLQQLQSAVFDPQP